MRVRACVCVLTVRAAIDFYAQPDPSFLAPVQRDEPEEARHDSLLQLVADGALGVGVAGEGLRAPKRKTKHMWTNVHNEIKHIKG